MRSSNKNSAKTAFLIIVLLYKSTTDVVLARFSDDWQVGPRITHLEELKENMIPSTTSSSAEVVEVSQPKATMLTSDVASAFLEREPMVQFNLNTVKSECFIFDKCPIGKYYDIEADDPCNGN